MVTRVVLYLKLTQAQQEDHPEWGVTVGKPTNGGLTERYFPHRYTFRRVRCAGAPPKAYTEIEENTVEYYVLFMNETNVHMDVKQTLIRQQTTKSGQQFLVTLKLLSWW